MVHAANTDIIYANARATPLLGISYDAMLGALVTDKRWEFFSADGGPLPIADFPVLRVLESRKTAPYAKLS